MDIKPFLFLLALCLAPLHAGSAAVRIGLFCPAEWVMDGIYEGYGFNCRSCSGVQPEREIQGILILLLRNNYFISCPNPMWTENNFYPGLHRFMPWQDVDHGVLLLRRSDNPTRSRKSGMERRLQFMPFSCRHSLYRSGRSEWGTIWGLGILITVPP